MRLLRERDCCQIKGLRQEDKEDNWEIAGVVDVLAIILTIKTLFERPGI